MLKNLWKGFVSPFTGIRYLKSHPKLLGLAMFPFLMNIIIILGGLGYIIHNGYWIDALVTKYGFETTSGWFFWFVHSAFVVVAWITLIIFMSIAGYFIGQLL